MVHIIKTGTNLSKVGTFVLQESSLAGHIFSNKKNERAVRLPKTNKAQKCERIFWTSGEWMIKSTLL